MAPTTMAMSGSCRRICLQKVTRRKQVAAGAAEENQPNDTGIPGAVDNALNIVWSLLQQINPNDPDALHQLPPEHELPVINEAERERALDRARIDTLRRWRRELVQVYQCLLSIRDVRY